MTNPFATHPGFHGFTVVLYTSGPMTYVGRWDEQVGGQIFLNNVSVHRDGDAGMSRQQFIEKTVRLGPRATHDRYAVPAGDVTRVETLGELSKKLIGI